MHTLWIGASFFIWPSAMKVINIVQRGPGLTPNCLDVLRYDNFATAKTILAIALIDLMWPILSTSNERAKALIISRNNEAL